MLEEFLTEKFKNVCIGLGALTGLVLGLMANLKGEPMAERTWTTLRDQVNQQADALNDIQVKLVTLQAHEEGRTNAILQAKIDALQKELDAALRHITEPSVISLGGGGGSGVQSKQKKADARFDAVASALKAEQQRRQTSEVQKHELQKQLQDVKKLEQAPTIQKLPNKLDDAVW